MRTHNYLARIDDEIWLDLNRVKQLDGRSINSLLLIASKLTSFSLILPAVPKNVHIVRSESGVTNIKQVPVGNSSFFLE